MQYPDEFLSPVQLSLQDLVQRSRAFLEQGTADAVDHFINLNLAGRLMQDEEEHRVLINPVQGAEFPTMQDVTQIGRAHV